MNFRKIVSLTALLSFIFLLLTSIVLFIVPHGRVAYWSNWQLWGLSKTQWGDLHTNGGFLFILFSVLHIYLNLTPIMNYLKNQAKKMIVFTKEFNVAIALMVVVCVGTYLRIPPFSWVQSCGESIKNAAIAEYGEPPYGHAELSSLKVFTQKTGMDMQAAMASLKEAGIEFENGKQSIKDIATQNNMTPKEVYNAMKPKEAGGKAVMPPTPRPGLGKRTIKDICAEFGLEVAEVVASLKAEQIEAKGDMTLKEIAAKNQTSPMDIYMSIYNSAKK